MLIVDTNVLVDVLEDDPEWGEWSVGRMRDLARVHEIVINPVIYAELSLAFDAVEDLDAAIADLDLGVIELPRPALFLAGKAFVRYRRLGGIKSNVLADFFIGAHAAVAGCPILTRDPRRYRSYFPSLRLIVPDAGTPT
ncbi:MAG: type II toxin-antitoxin system VapC family toxin [Ectothiorhodospiraceae bacterium]|nr:type II toxin-antitoxin system VapC family toxin [Ectothiorhodospiraceae bacterium]